MTEREALREEVAAIEKRLKEKDTRDDQLWNGEEWNVVPFRL